jgi:membrane-associated phospholipid phosphatase
VRIRLSVFLLLLLCIGPLQGQNLDIRLLRQCYTPGKQAGDDFFQGITDSYPLFVAGLPLTLGAVSLIRNDKELLLNAVELGATAVYSAGVTLTVKYAVRRDRPFLTYPDIVAKDAESGPSFPSFHTAASFGTATSLSLMYPRWYVIVPSYVWAGAVGYSRLRLGVHYPSDVLCGALVGSGSAWISHRLRQWYQRQLSPKHGKFE